jgi:desulfoferrodoxin (superoxide reductase-like protein)
VSVVKAGRRLFVGSLGATVVAGASALVSPGSAQDGSCRPLERARPRELTSDATGLDRMHLPVIALPARPRLGRSFDLVVRIGEPMHEQRRDHHIAWVEVAYGADRLFVCDLSPDVPFPVVRVPVVLRRADELVVRVACARDGSFVWRLPLAPA